MAQSIQSLIEQPDFLKSYSLILLTAPIQIKMLSTIRQYAWDHLIPTFYIHSLGFYSQLSVQLPLQYPIVDTHPDPTSTQDLRLLSPWSELSKFAADKCNDLESLSDHDHGHIPYLLLLLHHLEKWKGSHDGKNPDNYKEKTAFRGMVRAGARVKNAEGGEENYDEAVGAVLKSLNSPSLSSGVREIFSAEDCKTPTSQVYAPFSNLHKRYLSLTIQQSANFWIIAHAIHTFHTAHAVLPVPGSLPDMKAQSSDYIQLQNIYKTKARHDLAEVLQTVRALEKSVSRTSPIDEKEVEAFCKGAAFIKLIHGRRLQIPGEKVDWDGRAKSIYANLQDADSLVQIYIAFLAYDHFTSTHFRAPSADPSTHDEDLDLLAQYTTTILTDLYTQSTTSTTTDPTEPDIEAAKTATTQIIKELLRAGGGELHNISALTGGMVAQEVIKVVTRQYVPVDNCCVFDGVGSRTAVFKI